MITMHSYSEFTFTTLSPAGIPSVLFFFGPWNCSPLSELLTVGGLSPIGTFVWHSVQPAEVSVGGVFLQMIPLLGHGLVLTFSLIWEV